ncbi:MAG TPA: BTAD domain-containing putative transcriptional regulator [Trebonia sp.]|nr:BTAD domain-containing putative transcriptional regulator [Trebonia sp.]
MHFAVLGTVRAENNGQPLELPPKERVILAALLLRAGEVVPVSALATAAWDHAPPPSARSTIQGRVMRLRQAMGSEAGRIVTRSPGYLIEVGQGELDLATFMARSQRARDAVAAGSWERAAGLFTQALALWRGEPLSGLASAHLRRVEVPRLTELRDEAITARIDADLRLGRHGAVTAELRALVATHPLRERFWEQLVLALYRDGRPGDALDAYAEARRTLVTELGLEPGPRLRGLQSRVLRADPALDLRASTAAARQARQSQRPIPPQRPAGSGRDGAARGEPARGQAGGRPGVAGSRRAESVKMVRFLVRAFEAGGADAGRLASEARVPDWALRGPEVMGSPYFAMHLWEVAGHAFEDPQLPLTVSARFQQGELDLYDYLFTTAPTLRDGFRLSRDYLHLLTTNARLDIEAAADHEVTYSYRYLDEDAEGAAAALQFSIAIFCARARAGTGQPITPVRIAFKQPAPRRHRAFSETFGTPVVDFGAPVTTFTFRARDLDVPMPNADPALARILTRYAATLSPAPIPTWEQEFRELLIRELDDGTPSLTTMARRMSLSPRTVQRQLAERGTSWRAELDAARQWRASQLAGRDPASAARHLGYAHPRSVSRAIQRWSRLDEP